jgi:hypothetical protein
MMGDLRKVQRVRAAAILLHDDAAAPVIGKLVHVIAVAALQAIVPCASHERIVVALAE